ncbi:hypothetical protein F5148DRAFT_618080 [Russula earlei]|uniref:Uncharacterized protein n=1 Tax=Russula earlei TaxID=71964 RepID=A0ACC0UFG1_9AGAM|nr:hypothetical protein F5148DRAFT_618080 [Russula earlei]
MMLMLSTWSGRGGEGGGTGRGMAMTLSRLHWQFTISNDDDHDETPPYDRHSHGLRRLPSTALFFFFFFRRCDGKEVFGGRIQLSAAPRWFLRVRVRLSARVTAAVAAAAQSGSGGNTTLNPPAPVPLCPFIAKVPSAEVRPARRKGGCANQAAGAALTSVHPSICPLLLRRAAVVARRGRAVPLPHHQRNPKIRESFDRKSYGAQCTLLQSDLPRHRVNGFPKATRRWIR